MKTLLKAILAVVRKTPPAAIVSGVAAFIVALVLGASGVGSP